MNKNKAIELNDFAQELANRYSRKDREGNYNQETFNIYKIIPTSEDTASLIMQKNTDKRALLFCYYINRGMSKGWKYFVPTDSHFMGMRASELHKFQIEEYNFDKNL